MRPYVIIKQGLPEFHGEYNVDVQLSVCFWFHNDGFIDIDENFLDNGKKSFGFCYLVKNRSDGKRLERQAWDCLFYK